MNQASLDFEKFYVTSHIAQKGKSKASFQSAFIWCIET